MKHYFSSKTPRLLKTRIIKYLLEDEVIMNWSVLKKSILILSLGSFVHLVWITWKICVLMTPHLWEWVNLSLVQLQLKLDILFLGLLVLMIFPCAYWSNRIWVQQRLPYLSIGILVLSLCRNGSMIGLLSPATMVSYVSLVTVGLLLFKRKIIYYTFIPVTCFLILSTYLSLEGYIRYAPIFDLDTTPYENKFWVISMLCFIAPILIICLILFEILLSQWRHREKQIQHLSQIDPLTNALNRRSIALYLEKLAHQSESCYAVVLIDLDYFKQINDQYGHSAGDDVLIKVTEFLSNTVRENDIVGRFGGEEFILLLNQCNLAQAQNIAERCRYGIQHLDVKHNLTETIQLTASFGIATSSKALQPEHIVRLADQALYEAKACGRNQVKYYTAI